MVELREMQFMLAILATKGCGARKTHTRTRETHTRVPDAVACAWSRVGCDVDTLAFVLMPAPALTGLLLRAVARVQSANREKKPQSCMCRCHGQR
eukprot:3760905-Pleurochrysis_carterae.AAC.5